MGMICARCGKELAETAVRCAACGAPIISDGPTLVGSAPGEMPTIAAVSPLIHPAADAEIDADVTRIDTSRSRSPRFLRPFSGAAGSSGDADAARAEARPDTGSGTDGAAGVDSHPQGPLAVGQRFGGRYHIVRLLGLGGMGAVYQAWDEELAVVVAVKVTRPEIASDPEAAQLIERRFKQELLLARQVTHKNVVRIHDLGEVNGIKYITMPYIEGEDLSSVLEREGALPLPRVLRIARSLVSGLAAAHAAGVVHRDLKPANVMIDSDGEALITDFGIARSTGATAPRMAPEGVPHPEKHGAVAADHTVLGAVVGTIGYMAPEQAQAQPVDQRADIYAVGLIIYDMLGGRVRFERAESGIAELTSRTLAPPPPLKASFPAVPDSIDKIIAKCLQPDPAARYQTTQELADALDRIDDTGKVRRVRRALTWRLAGGVAAVFIALLTMTWWLARGTAPPKEPPPVSVLIADFDNKTGEPVFSGAIEQALSISMEGASFINAYPRAKAKQVAEGMKKGAALDEPMAELVAKREEVNIVLAGAIERDGTGYAISARALDATPSDTPRELATAKVKANNRDDVLAKIGKLAGELRKRLGDRAESASAELPSDTFTAASLDAMRAYVRGQDLQIAGKWPEALAAYQEAVKADPGFGRAYAGMGVTYASMRQPDKSEESYKQALQHLGRMTEREKYSTLGGYYLLVSNDYDKAVENYEALVSRYPVDRGGHANLALAYLNKRQIDKALVEVRKALDLEPRNVLQQMNYAMYLLYAGDFPKAIEASKKIPKDSGFYPYALLTEGRAAAAGGDLAAARDAFSRLDALGPDGAPLAAIARADLSMYEGRYAAAVVQLRTPVAGAAPDPADAATRALMIAEAQHALGRKADALKSLDAAMVASRGDEIVVPAGLLLSEMGDTARAEAIARDLDKKLQAQSPAYAGLIRGAVALGAGRLPAAVDALRESKKGLDSWFVHLMLGRTYLAAAQSPEALAEFDLCLKRQGEATDAFFANGATLRYLPPVRYWLARAQDALGAADARQNYEWYVKLRGGTDAKDPLLVDARARLKK